MMTLDEGVGRLARVHVYGSSSAADGNDWIVSMRTSQGTRPVGMR